MSILVLLPAGKGMPGVCRRGRSPESRKGYARKIMDGLIQDAERMQLSVIDLLATEDGYPLYQKVGFKDDESKYHPMKWRPSGSH